jgi:hypothetical protein
MRNALKLHAVRRVRFSTSAPFPSLRRTPRGKTGVNHWHTNLLILGCLRRNDEGKQRVVSFCDDIRRASWHLPCSSTYHHVVPTTGLNVVVTGSLRRTTVSELQRPQGENNNFGQRFGVWSISTGNLSVRKLPLADRMLRNTDNSPSGFRRLRSAIVMRIS